MRLDVATDVRAGGSGKHRGQRGDPGAVGVDPHVDRLAGTDGTRRVDLESAEPQACVADLGAPGVARAGDAGLERQIAELREVGAPAHRRPGRIDAALDGQLVDRALGARPDRQRSVDRQAPGQREIEDRRGGGKRRGVERGDGRDAGPAASARRRVGHRADRRCPSARPSRARRRGGSPMRPRRSGDRGSRPPPRRRRVPAPARVPARRAGRRSARTPSRRLRSPITSKGTPERCRSRSGSRRSCSLGLLPSMSRLNPR